MLTRSTILASGMALVIALTAAAAICAEPAYLDANELRTLITGKTTG
jgi:hypothetical protein